jgi:virginiamycin B lyase
MAKLGPTQFLIFIWRSEPKSMIREASMRGLLLFLAGVSVAIAPAGAQPTAVQITEWTVPWEKTRPRDPFLDAAGNVWFVGQAGNYVGNLNPKTGAFKRFEIDSGTNPHSLVIDASGNVWISGNLNGRLVKMDPASGKLTTFPVPDLPKSDPHTMVFDRSGNMWFTMQTANMVGRLDPKSGKIALLKATAPRSRPYGILLDTDQHPWFVEFGTNKVGTIDPATMQLTEHLLPNDKTRPRRIARTSDGSIWYGDYMRGMLGKFDPRTRTTREWPMPSGATSLPYGMASDDHDRVWLAETGVQPNRLVAFDSKSEKWVYNTAVEKSGGGTIRHMVFHKPTRTIWFGTDANTIGRVSVP